MLNSAEQKFKLLINFEIAKSMEFPGLNNQRQYIILLINVKMPTSVAISGSSVSFFNSRTMENSTYAHSSQKSNRLKADFFVISSHLILVSEWTISRNQLS